LRQTRKGIPMIKSMTGYGKAEIASGKGTIGVEIRSVNHRYGEISVKLPRQLLPLEHAVRKCVSEQVKRGKAEVFIQYGERGDAVPVPAVNLPQARAYHEALILLREDLGLNDPIPLALIAVQKDVLVTGEGESLSESLQDDLLAAVRQAVDCLDAMRLREGMMLLGELRGRRESLTALHSAIRMRAPLVVTENAVRLRERVSQLVGDSGVDDARLAMEIAVLADRCDITEELVRFESHLQQFDETLIADEPVGRKLDFLLQELNREANTMGSKANDAEIAGHVVALKAELEKIREQVQNIE